MSDDDRRKRITQISGVNYDYIKKNVYYNRFYVALTIIVNINFIFLKFVTICSVIMICMFINFFIYIVTLTIVCLSSIIVINN